MNPSKYFLQNLHTIMEALETADRVGSKLSY